MRVNFIKTLEDSNVIEPQNGDSGFDLVAAQEPTIVGSLAPGLENVFASIDYIEYDTGIVVDPCEEDLFSFLMPRSSVSKYWLTLANGVGLIDNGYRGTVRARFKYNWQFSDLLWRLDGSPIGFTVNPEKIYQKGDKIAQLVFAKNVSIDEVGFAEKPTETERGDGGFGSTGS